jgi:uncharacterized protein (DUF302 family)
MESARRNFLARVVAMAPIVGKAEVSQPVSASERMPTASGLTIRSPAMSNCQNPSEITGTATPVPVVHRRFRACVGFASFTKQLERILGRFDQKAVEGIAAENPTAAASRIKGMEGEQGLMIFGILDHGAALNMAGQHKKAKQYLIGNPLTAIRMTQHRLGAALYAPLRVLVYEDESAEAVVEYDQPSSLVAQFGDDDVNKVGAELDSKLLHVLRRAVDLSES